MLSKKKNKEKTKDNKTAKIKKKSLLHRIFIIDKEEKKEPEPQYYSSPTNIKTLNYKVYYMSKKEKIVYFLLAFIVGAAIGYLFYGGIGKDEYGQATMLTYILNISIPFCVGVIAGKLFLPIRVQQIIKKREKKLREQFRDMLESLTTSLGAGNNVVDSFSAVREDMKMQYEEDAYIIKELDVIVSAINNNYPIEDVLYEFGDRSGIPDIVSFSEVFRVSYRKGGNIQDIIRNTHDIISDKMEIAEHIETTVASNKLDQNIMICMPIGLIAVIKMMSPDFAANFVTVTGIIATTIAIGFFVLAYYIGKAVLDIKI
jgi:tight adherence protein B